MPTDPGHLIDQNEQTVVVWRKSLVIKTRDKSVVSPPERLAAQRKLLRSAYSSSADLSSHLRENLQIVNFNLGVFPKLDRPLEEGELHSRLPKTARSLHGALTRGGCTRRHASAGSYWLYCIIHWLEQSQLVNPPAPQLIPNPVKTELLDDNYELTPDESTHIDNRTRDLLRNMGGVPHIRDRIAYMSDCPAAHMWWAVELTNDVAGIDGTTFDADTVLSYLLKVDIMEEVIRWISRFVGRLAQPLALAATFEAAIGKEQSSQPSKAELRNLMEKLARRGRRWRLDENSPFSVKELAALCAS